MRRLLPSPADEVDVHEEYAVDPGGRPHVRMNFVASVDGASTLHGLSEGLSGPADKRVFGVLRDLADVVLVGAATARNESYGPARMSQRRRDRRRSFGLAPIPPVAVVSRVLDLDPTAALFTEAVERTIVFTDDAAPLDQRKALAEVADVIVAGRGVVDPRVILDTFAERGLLRVLSEGGPALFGSLARAGVVDELCLTVAPLLAGPGPDRILRGTPFAAPQRMALAGLLEEDEFLFCRYRSSRS